MEQREGVGEKREQLITRISIDFGFVPVRLKAFRTQSYITVSLSFLAAAAERSALLSDRSNKYKMHGKIIKTKT